MTSKAGILAPLIALFVVATLLGQTGCTRRRELGNVLHIQVRDKYKSLDPIHGQDFYSNVLIRRAYEGLLQYHYLKRPYALEPLLADGMPTVSKDGLTYTFKVRSGVRFQDDRAFKATGGRGREVTAHDFVYSLLRIADPAQASEGWWTLDGKIQGLNAWADQARKTGKADYAAAVPGLYAPDERTLVIKLVKPNPLILAVLTMPYTDVVAREAVEFYGKELGLHPVGTGPFQLDTLTPTQAIWVKNPTFHGEKYPSEGAPGDKEAGLLEDAGKPLPFVDKVVDDIIIEDQPSWLNFMQGNHDYLPRMSKDNVADIFDAEHHPKKELRDLGIDVLTTPGLWFNYIAFNAEDPVVGGEKNKALRRAMAMALDEAPMIEKFYLGLATRAESPIPPGIPGFDTGFRNPSREYNLVKAREILAKAGHPGGEGIPELNFETTADMTYRQIAEYVQRQMAGLGLKVNIVTYSWPELLGRLRRKQAQLWHISWQYDYPDAENGLQLLYSKNESPGANEANYKNPRYDVLYEKMAAMPNGPARFELIRKMRDLFVEDVPWIVTVNQMETRMSHSWLHNLKIHGFEHNVEKYLRVDVADRVRQLR